MAETTALDWQGRLTRMLLGEVTIEMNNDDNTIYLKTTFKTDFPSIECFEESLPKDFSNIQTWDLSHNLLTNEMFVYGIVDKVKGKKWHNIEFIDLSYNHLSPKCIPQLWSWLRNFPNATIKLSYNGIVNEDLKHVPKDVGDRIDLSTKYDQTLKITEDKMERKWRELKDWQKIEDDVLEEELTRGTVVYYKRLGYTAFSCNVSNIYRADGNVLLQLDGVVIADSGSEDQPSILATVESKHNLVKEDVDDRRKLLTKFMRFLQDLPESCDKQAHIKYRMMWGMLSPLRGMTFAHFIGGVNVPESVKNYAQKKGFHVLQYRGSRFDVAEPRGVFKPIEDKASDADT